LFWCCFTVVRKKGVFANETKTTPKQHQNNTKRNYLIWTLQIVEFLAPNKIRVIHFCALYWTLVFTGWV